MKKGLKIVVGLFIVLAAAGTATLLIIKYFDVLVSMALDLKEKVIDKKRALFSTTCCADDDECEEPEDFEIEAVFDAE